jgi:hypothetical protein
MVGIKAPNVDLQANRQAAVEEAPEFERISWTKNPNLRKLYINCIFGLLVASATTGYDGYVNCEENDVSGAKSITNTALI